MRYVNCIVVFCVLFLFIPIVAFAGSLDDPGAPTSASSAMYTLEDIYNRLNAGTAGAKRTGAFTEPSSAPGSTGHTTDDIMGKAPSVDNTNGAGVADVATGKKFWGLKSGEWGLKTGTGTIATDTAPVAKTGQTICYNASGTVITCTGTGQDGDKLKGVTWPNPRFTDNGDGTVTDNLTGLLWLKNGNCFGLINWNTALSNCNGLASGSCGLTDGSSAGDWRLPNVKEFLSLIDWAYYDPALSNDAGTGQWTSGDAFTIAATGPYWSSTTHVYQKYNAWMVYLGNGDVEYKSKGSSFYVWPVRGGQ